MDDNALDIKNHIEMGLEDLEKMENEKDPHMRHAIPGEKVQKLMESWDKEEKYTPEEME